MGQRGYSCDKFKVQLDVVVSPQGGFVGALRILPESSPFSVGSDGTVRVKDSSALDRETTESFTFQVTSILD